MADNTIFDDVFKTMIEKMPSLAVPLINEVFGTEYPENVKIERLDKEYHTKNQTKLRITDSHLKIGNKIYHIECQSTGDGRMVVRMVEYDFLMGLETVEKVNGRYQMIFPHSCILNLRGYGNRQMEEMDILMPDGQKILYKVPVIWLKDYTQEVIFQKHLLFLLPFYIIKYEKSKERLSEDDEYLQQMLAEYKEIQKYLEKELWNGKQINSVNNYKNLVDLIGRIVDYILENTEKARKGVREVMGGKVLELATEREERLRREREEKLSREGREEGQESILKAQIQKKLQKQKSISEIAEELETDQATVRRIMKKLGQAQV